MPDTVFAEPHRIALDALPEGAAPAQRPDAAHVIAVGIGDPANPSAWAVLRQRRTASMTMVTGWQGGDEDAALAQAVEEMARARGAALIRATPDQTQAIAALKLTDTGRGYAQRWLVAPVESSHDTGSFIQTTGFTCGPVSLAMAMGPGVTRSAEIAIWREATTMIGLTGPGGCDPFGVALAAHRRGFAVTLWFDSDKAVLLDRADTEAKKDLMRFVQSEFRAEAEGLLDLRREAITPEALTQAVRDGAQVILLIDQCHTHDHHAPHWVLVHAERDGVFLLNDPWAEPEDGETIADVDGIPVRAETLMTMAAYGDPAYHAAIVLRGSAG